jgi:hypothetical protein
MQDALDRVDVDRVVKCTVLVPCNYEPDNADIAQLSYLYNNLLGFLQETPLARQIHAFYTAPSTHSRFSEGFMSWTSRRLSCISGAAGIMMVALELLPVQKVMLRKVSILVRISTPESQTAPVFVCVAALAILDRLNEIDQPTLCWWLSERQLPNGGINGRPEKLEDVSFRIINCSDCIHHSPFLGLLQFLGAIRSFYLGQAHMDKRE